MAFSRDSVILLGIRYVTINPQIIGPIFEKIYCFPCKLPLTLWVGRKLEKARNIGKKTLDIEFQRGRSIGLGSTFDNGHAHR